MAICSIHGYRKGRHSRAYPRWYYFWMSSLTWKIARIILFQEHYTWQGRLIWLNENQEAAFRSAIELLKLLDEILAGR